MCLLQQKSAAESLSLVLSIFIYPSYDFGIAPLSLPSGKVLIHEQQHKDKKGMLYVGVNMYALT